jgi:hypothetical protein
MSPEFRNVVARVILFNNAKRLQRNEFAREAHNPVLLFCL